MAAKWAFADSTDDTNAAAYYVYDTSGVGLNEVYLSADFYLCVNQLAALTVNGGDVNHTGEFWRTNDLYGAGAYTPPQTNPALIVQQGSGHAATLTLWMNGNGKFSNSVFGEFGPVFTTADVGSVTVQMHLNISGHTLVYKINGTTYDQSGGSWVGFPVTQIDAITFGQTRANLASHASVQFLNYTNVDIGTTAFGSTDLLTTDFSGGTFSAFTGTVGDMSIITSPSCAPVVPAKLVFSNWLRIESSPGGIIPPPPPPTGGGGGGSGPPTGGGGGGGGGGFPVPPSSANYAAAIAYTANRPAFTPSRTVEFSNESEFNNALSDFTPGDYIRNINGSGGFDVPGEFTGFQVNGSSLGAVIDLAYSGVANQVRFTGTAHGSHLPAVWIAGTNNIRIYGGDITNAGSAGILVNAGNSGPTSNVLWWGFNVHDVGGQGLAILPVVPNTGAGGTATGMDFQGTCTRWGQDLGNDPHSEAGTGLHGGIFADVDGATSTNWRVSLQCYQGPTGAAMELGQIGGGVIANMVFNVLADTLTFQATSQVAANTFQTWGDVVPTNVTIGYLEGRNQQGRCTDSEGGTGTNFSGITVLNGVGFNCCLNPHLGSTEPSNNPGNYWWIQDNPADSFVYTNITPAQIP